MYFYVGKKLCKVFAITQFPNQETDYLIPVMSTCSWNCDLDANCQGTGSRSNKSQKTLMLSCGLFNVKFLYGLRRPQIIFQQRGAFSRKETSFRQMVILAMMASSLWHLALRDLATLSPGTEDRSYDDRISSWSNFREDSRIFFLGSSLFFFCMPSALKKRRHTRPRKNADNLALFTRD